MNEKYESEKIVPFNGITKLNIEPDRVLKAAIGNVKEVVICAVDNEDLIYFASSMGNEAEVNYIIDRCKKILLDNKGDEN